jgi:hypothetical protein
MDFDEIDNTIEKLDSLDSDLYSILLKCIGFDRKRLLKNKYNFDEFFIIDNVIILPKKYSQLMQLLVDMNLMTKHDDICEERDAYSTTDFALRYIQGREHVIFYKTIRL